MTENITTLIIAVCMTSALAAACRSSEGDARIHQFENYSFDRHARPPSRAGMPPRMVLGYLQRLDNRTDYAPYLPSDAERAVVGDAYRILPERTKSVLENRLIGIYFIKNFTGNGLCEWVVDRRGKVYIFLVFNPRALGKTASELLTEKEQTCFFRDDPSIEIRVDCGNTIPGFYYILLHESAHAVDYVLNITPFVDEEYKRQLGIKKTKSEFTKNSWAGYNTSKEHFIFSQRVSFYGMDAPKLKSSEAVAVYKDLARSPFASLYGSMSWAEDLAELAAFYHITHVLKGPYAIHVVQKKKTIFSVRPMETAAVIERLPMIRIFYSRGT